MTEGCVGAGRAPTSWDGQEVPWAEYRDGAEVRGKSNGAYLLKSFSGTTDTCVFCW